MIRDPSDGSVREKTQVDEKTSKSAAALEKPLHGNDLMLSTTSGLPAGSTKPEQIARLERSRQFVRDYHAKKSEGAEE